MIFSAIVGAISSAIASIGTIITSVAAKVGPVIAKVATGIKTVLSKIDIEKVGQFVNILSNTISTLDSIFKTHNEKISDDILGAASSLVDYSIDDFESTQEYIDSIKQDIESGRIDCSRILTEENKLGYQTIGMSIKMTALNEKTGLNISPEVLNTIVKVEQALPKIIGLDELLKYYFDECKLEYAEDVSCFLEEKPNGHNREMYNLTYKFLESNNVENPDRVIFDMMDACKREYTGGNNDSNA